MKDQLGLTTTQTEEHLKGYLTVLINSKKLPAHIKTVDDAFTIAQMGRELGFPTMQSFHYIIPIQGKLTLSAKATGALLRRGGVTFTTKEDGVMVYANGKLEPSTPDEKPVDQRTTIIFKRGVDIEECSFTWKDAMKQGLTEKDNWKRMPKEMLWARCLAKGSNRIGQDLTLGLYTTEEMTDSLNVDEKYITRNDDGTVAVVLDTATERK